MRNKLNQFISNFNGQFVEVSDETNKNQCMDLVYSWVFCLDIPKSTIQHLHAYEVYTKATNFTRNYFDIIENKLETIPQAGDIAVWKPDHIALVIEATQKTMKVFEQNDPLGTNAHIQDRKSYTGVLGFLRPKEVVIPSAPQWLETLLQEQSLTIKNESEIRQIFDKAKKADEEVATNYKETLDKVRLILRRLDVKEGDDTEEVLGVLENAVKELLTLRDKQVPEPRIIIAEQEMKYIKFFEIFIGVIVKAGDSK